MRSECCYSCPLKLTWDRMTPSCLQKQGRHGETLAAVTETRQLTLEQILYPPSTPARRSSPKVCPMTHLDFSSPGSESDESPAVDRSASVSIVSRAASVTSRSSSVCRRVSFRSPDASDVFVIPARRDSDDEDDDDDDSSDAEASGRNPCREDAACYSKPNGWRQRLQLQDRKRGATGGGGVA